MNFLITFSCYTWNISLSLSLILSLSVTFKCTGYNELTHDHPNVRLLWLYNRDKSTSLTKQIGFLCRDIIFTRIWYCHLS